MKHYVGCAALLQAHCVHFLSLDRKPVKNGYKFHFGPKTGYNQQQNILRSTSECIGGTASPYVRFAIENFKLRPGPLTWFVSSYVGIDCLNICDWLTSNVYVETYKPTETATNGLVRFAIKNNRYFDLRVGYDNANNMRA